MLNSTKTLPNHIFVVLVVALSMLSCTRLYTLPDAPPKEQWQSHAIEEAENPDDITMRQLEAKRAAIQVYAALSSKDWEKAVGLMSAETVELLSSGAKSKKAADALAQGYLDIRDQNIPFDPVADVFIANLSDIRADFGTNTPESSKTRQILYAVGDKGTARKIAMIKEGGRWVLHSPTIKSPIIEE